MSIHDDLAEEAADALRWAMRLRLTPAEWSHTEEAMARLDDALVAGDQKALRDAVFDLDQLSRRVTEKVGTDSDAPPSPKQRDRANELIHRLTPDPDADRVPGTENQK